MKAIAAKDAKNHFGELMDTVQREPVTIKKHGRAVAVVLSNEEYKHMKLERLRAEIGKGLDQLKQGEYIETDKKNIQSIFEEIKTKGQERRSSSE